MNRRIGILLFAAACGGDNKNNTDSGIVLKDGSGSGATMAVNGTGTIHFVTDPSIVDFPLPFDMFTITGITPDGTSFDRTTGTGSAGTFTVDVGAQAPVFYVGTQLQTNPPAFTVGNSTSIDLSSSNFGRQATSNAEIVTQTTPTTITATGMASWGAVDDFEIMDSNNGAMVFSPQAHFATPLALGNTSITAQKFDWLDSPNDLLPDAAQGDTTVAFQLNTASGPDNYAAIRKIATAANFTVTNGETTSAMTLTMTDVPQNKQVAVAWKRSQFEALKSMVGPGAIDPSAGNSLLAVETLPDAKNRGFYGSCPDLVEFVTLPSGSGDLNETFVYGNPFTSAANPTWDEWVLMRFNFTIPLKAPGASQTAQGVTGGCEMDVPVATGTMTIAPDLVPVGNVKVGGMDAFTAQTGVTQTPTLTWDAPATGTALRYTVVVNSLTKSGASSVVTPIASFTLTGTSLQIPDKLLLQGTSYFAQITVISADGLPQSFCNIVTAPFTP